MRCQRCHIEVQTEECPQCGDRLESAAQAIQFEFVSSSHDSQKSVSERPDWRRELRRRLNDHIEKKLDRNSPPGRPSRKKNRTRKRETENETNSLFDYKLHDSDLKTKPRVVSRTGKKHTARTVAEKPLVRSPVKNGKSTESHLPKQKHLTLELPSREVSSSEEEISSVGKDEGLSHEVILSRLLAGMVDLTLPFLIAVVFVLSASAVLGFDFIPETSMRWSMTLSFCFFLFNSFFFLALTGQTPGMYLTDLRVVAEDDDQVSYRALAMRIALFLPVCFSVVGLCWGVFDPWRRCLHDRLSRTLVLPLGFDRSRRQ